MIYGVSVVQTPSIRVGRTLKVPEKNTETINRILLEVPSTKQSRSKNGCHDKPKTPPISFQGDSSFPYPNPCFCCRRCRRSVEYRRTENHSSHCLYTGGFVSLLFFFKKRSGRVSPLQRQFLKPFYSSWVVFQSTLVSLFFRFGPIVTHFTSVSP